jgi:hypothetical protein
MVICGLFLRLRLSAEWRRDEDIAPYKAAGGVCGGGGKSLIYALTTKISLPH